MRPSRKRIVLRRILAVLLLAVIAGAVVVVLTRGDDKKEQVQLLPPASGDGTEGPATHVSFLERIIPAPADTVKEGPVAPRSFADLAARLPLDRAVAQLFLVGTGGKDATAPVFDQLKRLDLGGVVVDGRNYDNAQQLAGLTAEIKAAASNATEHIPLWVMAEQDGGDYSQFEDLPPPLPPGEYNSAADATAALTESATTLKALGINGLLEPNLDVAAKDSALGPQAFSNNPDDVADYARRTVAACKQLKLFCAAKHFPGIGAADTPTDEGPAQVGLPLSQLEQRDLVPFAAAAKAGIPAMVIGEGLYEPDDFVNPAAMSSKIIGGLLRKRLRYKGVAITDDLADPGVNSFAQTPDAAVQAIKAGADMVYISGERSDQEAAYAAVLNAVRRGSLSEKRVREALLRVLLAKRAYSLLR